MKINFLSLLVFLFSVIACKPTFETPDANAGSADFSSYVAIGSSYTAGFADGALSKEGQAASFPVLLSARFAEVGGGNFNVPYLIGDKGVYPDPLASNTDHTLPRLALSVTLNCKGEEMLLPLRIADEGDDDANFHNMNNRVYTPGSIFHHFGIPSMKSYQAVAPGFAYDAFFEIDQFNPFYWRFASGTNSTEIIGASVIKDVLNAHPTFFTLELGMSDVINYAIDGGTGRQDNTYKPDLTSPSRFETGIKGVLDSLKNTDAKGLMTNIPDVLNFPYFRKIEYNALDIDAVKAQELTNQYAAQGLTFSEGKNAFVINDKGTIRQLKSTEFITLKTPVDSLKCADWGASVPLEDLYVLTEEEIALIDQYSEIYNNLLQQEADARGIMMVDLKEFFSKLNAGITVSGIDLSAEFVKGGFFSLDGLHPNPRGQAMIANEFIKAINKEFGATLALYDISQFEGAVFP